MGLGYLWELGTILQELDAVAKHLGAELDGHFVQHSTIGGALAGGNGLVLGRNMDVRLPIDTPASNRGLQHHTLLHYKTSR